MMVTLTGFWSLFVTCISVRSTENLPLESVFVIVHSLALCCARQDGSSSTYLPLESRTVASPTGFPSSATTTAFRRRYSLAEAQRRQQTTVGRRVPRGGWPLASSRGHGLRCPESTVERTRTSLAP